MSWTIWTVGEDKQKYNFKNYGYAPDGFSGGSYNEDKEDVCETKMK